MAASRKPFACPVCGEEVSPNAKSCPECGACDKSGWSENAAVDGLDLPEDEFDYEKFASEEFGGRPRKSGRQWFWWVMAVLVACAFAWLLLHGH